MVTEETLRVATDRLVEQFRPQRVIPFGSQAFRHRVLTSMFALSC
jgi:hypothetical protein